MSKEMKGEGMGMKGVGRGERGGFERGRVVTVVISGQGERMVVTVVKGSGEENPLGGGRRVFHDERHKSRERYIYSSTPGLWLGQATHDGPSCDVALNYPTRLGQRSPPGDSPIGRREGELYRGNLRYLTAGLLIDRRGGEQG